MHQHHWRLESPESPPRSPPSHPLTSTVREPNSTPTVTWQGRFLSGRYDLSSPILDAAIVTNQDDITILVGKTNLNLHLPLESWVRDRCKEYTITKVYIHIYIYPIPTLWWIGNWNLPNNWRSEKKSGILLQGFTRASTQHIPMVFLLKLKTQNARPGWTVWKIQQTGHGHTWSLSPSCGAGNCRWFLSNPVPPGMGKTLSIMVEAMYLSTVRCPPLLFATPFFCVRKHHGKLDLKAIRASPSGFFLSRYWKANN